MAEAAGSKGQFVLAARASALPAGAMCPFLVDGRERLVINTGDAIRVVDGVCTHEFALLSEGELEDGILWCPLHGAGFDVASGAATCPPATVSLRIYDVLVEDDEIWVALAPRELP